MSRRNFGRNLGVFCCLAVLFCVGQPSVAFQPANQNDIYEIKLAEFDLEGHESAARDAGSLAVTQAFADRYGVDWNVHSWNSQTGTPHAAYGKSVKLASSVSSAEELDQIARQVISGNAQLLGADIEQLRLTATPNAMGKWVAHYQQTFHDLDVWQAKIRVVVTEDGRLMLVGSDCYTNIELDPNPAISLKEAEVIAGSAVPFNPVTDRFEEDGTLMVLPVPISETEVEHHLVWRVRVRTEEPLGIWVTHVDAHSGEIVWRFNDIHFAYSGTTHGEVQIYGYCDGITGMTIPFLEIDVSGAGSVTSDGNGNWSIAGGGSTATVSCDLRGPYVDINNIAGAEAFFTGTAQDGVPFTVTFDDSNAQHDERDVFDAVNDVHDFFQLFDPGFGYPNQRITANVSRNSTCNAYWDGTINFYAEGGGCGNTGEMQQVVHHEFGHGVQNAILGGQGSQGLGEGNSDILGNLITQDPIIGRGFYLNNCTSGIRNSLNNLVYPDDVIGQQIHYAGQVIAGFNWDSMVLLQAMYGTETGTIMSGERWHYGRVLMHPNTQPDQVLATFIADDDNGDLDDGTPHHEIFCEAATNHGFECPEILVGVFLYHDAHPYSLETSGSYDIVGTAISLPVGSGDIVPSSVTLNYKVNGGSFNGVQMSATGNPDEYAAQIPAQPYGSVVEYYLYAENTLAASGTSPRNAPDELHYFQVDDEFVDEMESATAWSVGDTDDDASSGIWERVDPIGTDYNGSPVQLEDDHTLVGVNAFITGQHQSGQSAGYNDVDNGKTTLFSPKYDLDGAEQVSVSYWFYYTNNTGNNPNEDFWDVDVSNDGGSTWTSVAHSTTTYADWTEVSFDLSVYIAEPDVVQFRFIADDPAGSGSLVEAGIDDFSLLGVFDPSEVDGEGLDVRVVTSLRQNSPNPFGARTQVSFSLAKAGPIELKIYDAAGRQVKSLATGSYSAGEHQVTWDGTDDFGRPLAAGAYFYQLDTETISKTARMILLD